LITYFKDSRTLARYRSGLANLYLENFIVWLESQGYRRFTIRRHVREVVHFPDWAVAEGLALSDLDRGALHRWRSNPTLFSHWYVFWWVLLNFARML
jgi:hypothetical protein